MRTKSEPVHHAGETELAPQPAPRTEWERILLPVDFSNESRVALRIAVSLAADPEDRITLLHVVQKPSWMNGLDEVPNLKTDQAVVAEAEARLESWVRQQTSPDLHIETLVRIGDVAEEIVHVADHRDCDLIVLTEDPRGRFAGALFGSVSAAVRRNAKCSVVTIGPVKRERIPARAAGAPAMKAATR